MRRKIRKELKKRQEKARDTAGSSLKGELPVPTKKRSYMVEGEPKLKGSKREEICVKKRSKKNEIVIYGADTEK